MKRSGRSKYCTRRATIRGAARPLWWILRTSSSDGTGDSGVQITIPAQRARPAVEGVYSAGPAGRKGCIWWRASYGEMVGVEYAEPFLVKEVMQVEDVVELTGKVDLGCADASAKAIPRSARDDNHASLYFAKQPTGR